MNIKKMKLASKMAVIIGIILTVIFAVLIIVTILLSKSSISKATFGELNAISKSNAIQIQQMFDTVSVITESMENYLERVYSSAETNPETMLIPTEPEAIAMSKSSIYGNILPSATYDAELFITETARNTAVNNSDIVGIGAMFEPYKFVSDIKDYAFYVTQDNKDETITPFGDYEMYSEKVYYKDATEAKETRVTEPYEYNGINVVTMATPILYSDEIKGIVVADINIDNFNKIDTDSERYASMFANIVDNKGQIIFDSESTDNIGLELNAFFANPDEYSRVLSSFQQGEVFKDEIVRSDTGKKVTMFFNPIIAGSETWWSLTAVSSDDVNKAVVTTTIWLLALSIGALVLIIITTIWVLRNMLRPLKAVVTAAESISGGNLDVAITVQSQDEIGVLSQAFLNMASGLREIIADINYLIDEMSDGNFMVQTKAENRYVGDYKKILLSLQKINSNLSNTLLNINQSADQVSFGSEQVSSGAQALSQGATEQASAVEELAATINEISTQVKTNADDAEQANKKAVSAGQEMTESNQKMQDMIKAMEEISISSGQIGKIIKTIEDIAFQTNILALNAAVEAARAGAAGKGFAVVADEVRNLASKSAEASKNTSELIESSLKAVENGKSIADDTAKSLLLAVDGVKNVAEIISHISLASIEQAQSIVQVTQGVDQISSVVQTNSATAEESAAASEELSSQAQTLKSLVSKFRLKKTSDSSLASLETPPVMEELEYPQDSSPLEKY